MNDYQKARKIYRRNIIIGIGLGLYLLAFRIDWAEKLIYGILKEADGVELVREVGWSAIVLILYGIFAGIRKSKGKEDAYYGKLRILPKIYVGYLLLNIVLTVLMLG